MNIHFVAGLFFGFIAGMLFTQILTIGVLRNYRRQGQSTITVVYEPQGQIDVQHHDALASQHNECLPVRRAASVFVVQPKALEVRK